MDRFKNLDIKDLSQSPFTQFETWFEFAKKNVSLYPEAFSVSSIDQEGYPNSRYVLLRGYKPPIFQFFTNYNSQKGQSLLQNPKACMLFYWKDLGQQIRIWGDVKKSSTEDSDVYWTTRPLESRIHAMASNQSAEVKDFKEFLNLIHKLEKDYEHKNLPRPKNWGGFDFTAHKFEFWQEGEFRLHHRFLYTQSSKKDWAIQRLYP